MSQPFAEAVLEAICYRSDCVLIKRNYKLNEGVITFVRNRCFKVIVQIDLLLHPINLKFLIPIYVREFRLI